LIRLFRHLCNISDGQRVFFSAFVLFSQKFVVSLCHVFYDMDALGSQATEPTRTLMGGFLG
jgi:hypothetical protein